MRLQELVDALMERRKVLSHIATLQARAGEVRGGVDELTAAYGQTEPDKLIQPAPSGGLPAPPQIEEGLTPLPAISLAPPPGSPEDAPEDRDELESTVAKLIQIAPAPVSEEARVDQEEPFAE